MAKPKVKLNLSGIRELKRESGVEEFVRSCGERVLAAAEANAPVDTGEYKGTLRLEMDTHTVSGAVAHIISYSEHGALVEAKTGNLARSLDAAGGA